MITNIPPMQIVPVSGSLSLKQVANVTGASIPGAANVAEGGDLNAFIDAAESILTSAGAQGITLELAGRPVVSWYRDPKRDQNPIEPGAEGAPLGDRIYVETDDGWFFANWASVWWLIPFGETPDERPCESPGFSGCRTAADSVGLMPGQLPGEMLWRPSENPDMNPAGEVFAEDAGSAPSSPSSPSSSSAIGVPVLLLAGAAALFLID